MCKWPCFSVGAEDLSVTFPFLRWNLSPKGRKLKDQQSIFLVRMML